MIELTKEEKEVLKKKELVFNTMKDIDMLCLLNVSNLFKFKEIMADEFLPIYQKIYNSNYSSQYILTALSKAMYRETEIISSFNKDDVQKILNKIDFDILNPCATPLSEVKKLFLNANITTEEFISLLFSTNLKKRISSFSEINNCLDIFISTRPINNIETIIQTFKENNFEYNNFPLILTNPSVSKEKKIEILKKTYIKKDLPKFRSIMMNSMVDFNDVDIFIEATIMNNNRIKNKAASIAQFFKSILMNSMINRRTESGKIKNFELIQTKYCNYFSNSKFINEISGVNGLNYEQKTFITNLFSKKSVKEKINIVSTTPELKFLLDDISGMFKKAISNNNEDDKRALFELALNWELKFRNKENSTEMSYGRINIDATLGFETFIKYADEYKDNPKLSILLDEICLFNHTQDDLYGFIENSQYESDITNLLYLFYKMGIEKMHLFLPNTEVFLGFPAERATRSIGSSTFRKYKNKFRTIAIFMLNKVNEKPIAEYIKKNILDQYLNEENTEKFAANFISIYNAYTTKFPSGKTYPIEYIESVMADLKSLAAAVYDEETNSHFLENFETANSSIQLFCGENF